MKSLEEQDKHPLDQLNDLVKNTFSEIQADDELAEQLLFFEENAVDDFSLDLTEDNIQVTKNGDI